MDARFGLYVLMWTCCVVKQERDWEGTLGTGILVIVLLAVMAVPLLHLQLED